ncbi:MAG: hypothetical protein ABJJ53_02615 [Sulfitobacter sp.]
MTGDKTTVANTEWKLAEFAEVKAEQRDRIKFRDGLFYAAFAAYGGLGGYALLPASPVDAWIILAFVASLLGHLYLENEVKISGIRDFLKAQYPNELVWEAQIEKEAWRRLRKRIQAIIDVIAFGGVSVFCTQIAWSSGLQILPNIASWIVCVLGVYVIFRTVERHIMRYEVART